MSWVALLSFICATAQPAPNPVTLVWPLHGSSGAGGVGGYASSEVPVGAHSPFGALRLGPDTTGCYGPNKEDVWWPYNHYGGYYYNDTCVRAFSHTHAQGAGLGDGGSLGITIIRSDILAPLPKTPFDQAPYRSNFSHSHESAVPGYYAVNLIDMNTLAEVTVSGLRAGLHRYTCNAVPDGNAPCMLVADGCHRTHDKGCGGGSMAFAPGPNGTLVLQSALIESGAFSSDCGGVPVYIHAVIEAQQNGAVVAPSAASFWADGARHPGAVTNVSSNGTLGSLGASVTWAWSSQAMAPIIITVRVALSYVSLAGAAANLAAEQQQGGAAGPFVVSFEDAAARTSEMWGTVLSSVVVNDIGYTAADVKALADMPSPKQIGWFPKPSTNMTPEQRLSSFYSSLYHSFCAPTTYNDADGSFVGLDKLAHNVTWRGGNGGYLSDLSLWDVYRTQVPLLTLLAPQTASDLFNSMMSMFAQTGNKHVPHWVWANCETGCMPGSHGLAVLADFLVKGVDGPPASSVFTAAVAQLASQDSYAGLGYVPVPADGQPSNGASLTLEYAFDDFCGAVIAALANEPGNASVWAARAQNYRNTWDGLAHEFGGMCPRFPNGSFVAPCPALDLPPILANNWYTEGDGLQWTFSVPHDVPGLISLFASPADFVSLLQQMMVNTSFWPVNALPNPWYWAGNEPGLLAPWEFSWVNTDAWRTQYWVRWILDTYYQLVPDGVPGNDDFGATNSWAVWGCLGLYPVTATGQYVLTSPCFANVTVQPIGVDGPLLNIVAHNFSVANVFVTRATLNGKELATPFLNHSQLVTGSLLEFWLTDSPSTWGSPP